MILPMNLYFRDSRDYHELVFLLQFGAVISFYAQAYGFTLDVTTRAGLRSMRRAVAWTFVSVLWGRGIRYVIIGTRLLATIQGAGRPTLWKLGVVGLSGMGIFNFVVIVDTARKLWKFCVRTPMPIENNELQAGMKRLRLVDRWRGSDEELIRLFNGEGRPDGAPRPRQMSLEEVKRHRLSLPGGDRLGVSRRRPAARVAGDS